MLSVPALTVVAPVNELTLFSESVPRPALVRPPLPLKGELKATLLVPVSMIAACPGGNGRDRRPTRPTVLPAAYCSVPPPKVMLPDTLLRQAADGSKVQDAAVEERAAGIGVRAAEHLACRRRS